LSKNKETSEKNSNTLLHTLSNSALAATRACRRVCLIAFLKELSKLPLNEYKYSYIFIVVKRFILNPRKIWLPRTVRPARSFTLTGAICCETMKTDRFAGTRDDRSLCSLGRPSRRACLGRPSATRRTRTMDE